MKTWREEMEEAANPETTTGERILLMTKKDREKYKADLILDRLDRITGMLEGLLKVQTKAMSIATAEWLEEFADVGLIADEIERNFKEGS